MPASQSSPWQSCEAHLVTCRALGTPCQGTRASSSGLMRTSSWALSSGRFTLIRTAYRGSAGSLGTQRRHQARARSSLVPGHGSHDLVTMRRVLQGR